MPTAQVAGSNTSYMLPHLEVSMRSECRHGRSEGSRRLETVVRVDTRFQDSRGGMCLGGGKFQHGQTL